jgi:hypothetical protein
MPADSKELLAAHKVLDQLSPGEKLQVIEEMARSLRANPEQGSVEQERANLQRLLQQMDELAVCNPDDGFSGRDHDRLLYGGQA